MSMIRKIFYVLLIAVIILFSLIFLKENQQQVNVKLYQWAWEERLAVILVAAFVLGAVCTLLLSSLSLLRLRGRLMMTQRKLKKALAKIASAEDSASS